MTTGPSDENLAMVSAPGVLAGGTSLSYEADLILNAIPGGVLSLDLQGRATLVNDAAVRLLGWSAEELIGRPLHDLIHHHRDDGSQYDAEECPIQHTLRTGEVHQSSSDVFWRRDGTSFPVEFDSRPITRGGARVGALVAFRDRTEQQRAEERTRQLVREQFARAKAEFQHAQLREILVQSPALICVTRGPRHVIDTVNDLFRRAVNGRDVAGRPVAAAFAALPPGQLEALDRCYRTGEPFVGTEVAGSAVYGGEDDQRRFNVVVQPLRDESGAVYGLMTHAVEVTEQVRARQELERKTVELQAITDRFSLAAEAGRLGAWEWHIATGRVVWSTELERIHGLEPGTFPGTLEAYQRDIHPEDRDRVLRTITETVDARRPHMLEYRIVLPSGEVRWVEARGRMLLDTSARPERVVGICMDVTDRKHAEEALRVQHRLAALMADAGVILTRSDALQSTLQACAEALVRHVDAAFARIWTLERGADVLELQASAGMYTHLDGAHARIRVGDFKIGQIAQERQPHVTNDVLADERVRDREWARREGIRAFAGYPLVAGGELLGVLAMFARQPLTAADVQALGSLAYSLAIGIQKKRHREALQRSEEHLRGRAEELARLAAALERSNHELDAFAYAASHDLRAPLRGIANLAQWIEEDLTAQGQLPEDTAGMLQLMRSRMHRMEALIEGLLEYSRAGRVHRPAEPVDVRRLVQDAVDLLSPPERAVVEIEGDLPALTAERAPLQQVFLNLIGNALKHARRDDLVVIISARPSDRFWEFSVRDNGPGIPPEFHERVWGIFQTLEPRDKVEGTGIGLALVKKLVESQGGRVWVESAPDQGAAFRFLWPQ